MLSSVRLRYFAMLVLTLNCFAQSVSIGVTAGGRTTDDVTGGAGIVTPQSPRFVVGPTVELGSTNQNERANTWEFPMRLKCRLPLRVVNPFIEAGIAPRTISGTVSVSATSINLQTGQQTLVIYRENTNWSASLGAVAGGGRFGLAVCS